VSLETGGLDGEPVVAGREVRHAIAAFRTGNPTVSEANCVSTLTILTLAPGMTAPAAVTAPTTVAVEAV